jgi:hypothetical protein
MSHNRRMASGGKREGAGRKKTVPGETKVRTFRLTDDEYEKLKAHLEELRKNTQDANE